MARLEERAREALADVESQRDDAIVYLSAVKSILALLTQGHGVRACAQELARVLVRQLAIESCAVVLGDGQGDRLVLEGFASQTTLRGGDAAGSEGGWIALAGLAGAGPQPTCFRRSPDGGFRAVTAAELDGEGFAVVPFAVGDETTGVLVLHSLVTPAQVFGRAQAMALLADSVGQALTVARHRDSTARLCDDLSAELGSTRQALSAQQDTLRSRQDSIDQLTRELIRSNRVKSEFLGTVSHELRTPLNAILGYTALMREGAVGRLTEEQVALVERVLGSSRNLNMLIDDILFFVQVEADGVLLRPEPIAATELVESVLEALPDRPTADRVALRVTIERGVETIVTDVTLVRRVLFHLLSNAFKFTSAGEVAVLVEAGEEREEIVLTVRDTGVGIPAERQREVFQAFSQADSSNTRRYNGLGMGLALVQRAVQLLGGTITVESRPGAGSAFQVHLPHATEAAQRDVAPVVRSLHS